jgi:hypothetical protein
MSRTDEKTRVAHPATRLTKKELDEQIGRVAEELFAADTAGIEWAPVPISFADYAKRMQRFMVYN